MAAIIATLKGKVLIQIAGGEPVEVGTVEIPIHTGTAAAKPEVGSATMTQPTQMHSRKIVTAAIRRTAERRRLI